jgi:hypothetical protein
LRRLPTELVLNVVRRSRPTGGSQTEKVIAYVTDEISVKRILTELGLSPPQEPKPPQAVQEVVRVPVDEEGRKIEAP